MKFPESHTAVNLAAVKHAIMEEWGIRSKVACMVTDGAANIVACVNSLQIRHSHCIAHALNLVVKKALEQTEGLGELRGKARRIATYFRTSTLARERLLELQQQMGVPPHKLIQEVETHWNSTHDMMARLYEQRGPVGAALGSLRTDLAALTSAEYHSMSECLEVLSPLKVATVELSAEKNVSGSKIIPLVQMLRHNIVVKQREVRDVMAGQLCSHLVRLMGEKLSGYETASQHSMAILLDPRFKTMGFCNPTNSTSAVQRLTGKCASLLRDSTPVPAPPEPAGESSGMNLCSVLS